ncbi:MAG: S8 family serine peptidase [Phycisphaerae bacterium]|jgi:hypothetical protein
MFGSLRVPKIAAFSACAALMLAPNLACPPASLDGNETPTIVLPVYSREQVVPGPEGEGEIIAGMLLIDFAADATLGEIDALLADQALSRIGIVGGANLVSAQILDGRSEADARASIQAAPLVESAMLNYVVEAFSPVGSASPIFEPRGSGPKETLSQEELKRNWHLHATDALPALALSDELLGAALADVVVAVVDTGFQLAVAESGEDALHGSLLATEDQDLAPKLVDPTGYDTRTSTDGTARLVRGDRTLASNPLIGSYNTFHGLAVAAAALASGEDLVGPGRHAKFRPVRYSVGPGEPVTQVPPLATIDHVLGAFEFLAAENAANLRVLNFSGGASIAEAADRAAVSNAFLSSFTRLIAGNRIIVLASGNEGRSTELNPFALLAPTRDRAVTPRRGLLRDPIHAGLTVVGATGLPVFVPDAPPTDPLQLYRFLTGELPLTGTLDFEGRAERWLNFELAGGVTRSNFGPQLAVSAPGEAVPALTISFRAQEVAFGTSLAAPFVAGLAAEMFALAPSASNAEVLEIIEQTADDIDGGGPDDHFGFGRVNCWKALLTLLNRADPSNPQWRGVRFRWGGALGVPESVRMGGTDVKNVRSYLVSAAHSARDSSDSIPYGPAGDAVYESCFSFQSAALVPADDLPKIEVLDAAGHILFETPLRAEDLAPTGVLALDTDDYVSTLAVSTPAATVYGRVTSGGNPVPGARVEYSSIMASRVQATTDANGWYVARAALPDASFLLAAYAEDHFSEAIDVQVSAYRSLRQDLELLAEPESPFVVCSWSNPGMPLSCPNPSLDCAGADASVIQIEFGPDLSGPTYRFNRDGLVRFFIGVRNRLAGDPFGGSYDVTAPFSNGRYTSFLPNVLVHGDYVSGAPTLPESPVPAIPLERCREYTIIATFADASGKYEGQAAMVFIIGATDRDQSCFYEFLDANDNYTPVPRCE